MSCTLSRTFAEKANLVWLPKINMVCRSSQCAPYHGPAMTTKDLFLRLCLVQARGSKTSFLCCFKGLMPLHCTMWWALGSFQHGFPGPARSPDHLGEGALLTRGNRMQVQAERVLSTWRRESLFTPDALSEYEVNFAYRLSHHTASPPPEL